MSLTNMLRNINGEIELGRVLLAGSGIAAIVSPIAFQVWDMIKGAHFDVAAWCAAYPAGLGVLNGVGVFSIGKKEKDVAVARQTQALPPLSDKGTGQ